MQGWTLLQALTTQSPKLSQYTTNPNFLLTSQRTTATQLDTNLNFVLRMANTNSKVKELEHRELNLPVDKRLKHRSCDANANGDCQPLSGNSYGICRVDCLSLTFQHPDSGGFGPMRTDEFHFIKTLTRPEY